MTKADRLALIAKAQHLRNQGLSARDTAHRLHVCRRWINEYTNGHGRPGRPTNRRKYARERCVDFFAYALHWYRNAVI